MGVFLARDQQFKISFSQESSRKRTQEGNRVFQYSGDFCVNVNLIPSDNETSQARNFSRIIRSILEPEGLSELSATLKVIKTMQPDGYPPMHAATCELHGLMVNLLHNGYEGELVINTEVTLDQVGELETGQPKADLTIHFPGMTRPFNGAQNFQGKANRVIWPTGYANFIATKDEFVVGKITVELLPYSMVSLNSMPSLDLIGFQDLSMNDSTTDFELIGRDGSGARCHLNLLEVRIPTLKGILVNPSWPEGKHKIYQFHRVSDEAVVQFVRYLYTSNLDVAMNCPRTTIELLELGNQYGVTLLENCMKSILLEKPWVWFDIISAWNVFAYSSLMLGNPTLSDYDKLKDKAAEIIRKYVKNIFVGLPKNLKLKEDSTDLQTFKELLDKNTDAKEELNIALPEI